MAARNSNPTGSVILKTVALENFGVSSTLMPSSHMVQFLRTTAAGVGVTGREVGGRKQHSFYAKSPLACAVVEASLTPKDCTTTAHLLKGRKTTGKLLGTCL